MKNPFLNRRNTDRFMKLFNTVAGASLIPYAMGDSFINWFCSTSFASDDYLRHRTDPFREYLLLQGFQGDIKEITEKFLKVHFQHGWRTAALSHLSDKKFDKMITYKGLEIFEKGYQAGKGVVLVNSHFGWPSVALWLFVRRGYADFYSILGERGVNTTKVAGIRKDCLPHFLSVSRESKGEAFRLLFQAREKLETGGIVHILGDGQHGRSHFSFPFIDKVRGFRASFAELGLITEALIIPVFVLPAENGRALVEFHEPLSKGSEEEDHQQRLENILRQYAKLLESKWKENPHFIHGGFIDTHIRQVEAELLNEI